MDITFKYRPAGRHFPLYKQVEDHLRALIRRGTWKNDEMLPSRQSLARAFQVDLSTVQRAIAPLLEDGTLRAERGSGTYVSSGLSMTHETAACRNTFIGGSEQTSTALAVGIIACQISGEPAYEWKPTVLRTLERVLSGVGAITRIFRMESTGNSAMQEALDEATASGIDALAIVYMKTVPEWIDTAASVCLGADFPTFVVTTEDICYPIPHTFIDERAGGFQALAHLLNAGYRRVQFLLPFYNTIWLQRRIDGAHMAARQLRQADAFEAYPAEPEMSWEEWDRQEPAACRAQARAIVNAGLDRMDFRRGNAGECAFIVPNDKVAREVAAVLAEAEILPGRDVGLVSFDDTPIAAELGISSMRTPLTEMAETGARLLVGAKQGHPLPTQVRLQSQLILRDSSRCNRNIAATRTPDGTSLTPNK